MLISFDLIKKILIENSINVTGALHVGAHDCEEIPFYYSLGITVDDIVWIDAINIKVIQAKNRGIPNVYNAVITDKDDEEIVFNVSNNIQSSSVLEFGTHSTEHPHVVFVDTIKSKSTTINSFFERNNIDSKKYNFWNFDIQGAELMALKGAEKHLQYVSALYLEVNEKQLYKNCALMSYIDSYLMNFGFTRVATEMTVHSWGDALYIRKN